MGVCDSKTNSNNIPKIQPKVINPFSIGNDTTGILQKYNYTDTNIESIRQKNNGYLLPTALAKRDDVNKYYNLHEVILGESAYGQVCIGEKNGINYAIKKIKKEKLKDIKSILLEARNKFTNKT